MEDRTRLNVPYLVFMLFISVMAILILGTTAFLPLDASTRDILDYADDALCFFFFIDFLVSLRAAPNKWTYFVTWGWIDLLSCIPTVDYFRTGRLARIFRVFRVLRAIRSAKIIVDLAMRRRAESAVLATVMCALVLIVLSSIAILQFEDVPGANIVGAGDALWWTMETITTVGYGDKYPVTGEGRILGACVMIAGVSLIAIYTGAIAAWFLRPNARGDSSTRDLLKAFERLDTTSKAEVRALLLEKPSDQRTSESSR